VAAFQKRSLRWRLTWQLLLFQAGILVFFVVSLVGYLIWRDDRFVVVDPVIAQVAARAILRDNRGALTLRETQEFRELRTSVPNLWFIARSDKGEILQTGPVPARYRGFGEQLEKVRFAEIRDPVSPYLNSAVIREAEGPAGRFTVLGAGHLLTMSTIVLVFSNLVAFPLLALLVLVTVIALPLIVRRGLSGLTAAAAQLEYIDIDRRGVRLPDTGVPTEIRPFIEAVNRALVRLDEGYERHQRFILDAAHELRTPIAILQTRIESMPRGPFKNRILADANRISSLSEQLLDLQRIDRFPVLSPVNVRDLCESVVADLAPIAIDNGYQLDLSADDTSLFLLGDEGALRRVLNNLIQNAIEHGGGRGTICVSALRPGLIEVTDEGPGIPQADRERIFEPFHRLRPRDRGAGLGLHLVREILSRHNGTISVADSRQGSRFRIELPTTQWGSKAASKTMSPSAPSARE
jgi:two-component system OmpR family sensor kinase